MYLSLPIHEMGLSMFSYWPWHLEDKYVEERSLKEDALGFYASLPHYRMDCQIHRGEDQRRAWHAIQLYNLHWALPAMKTAWGNTVYDNKFL